MHLANLFQYNVVHILLYSRLNSVATVVKPKNIKSHIRCRHRHIKASVIQVSGKKCLLSGEPGPPSESSSNETADPLLRREVLLDESKGMQRLRERFVFKSDTLSEFERIKLTKREKERKTWW